ncbi:MAG: DNA-dependent RNA polymerase subunit epsilon [Bacillaceae bacterium]
MIFKVIYQENKKTVPVRENSKALYIEATSVVDVRKKLSHKPYNIEFIQQLSDAHLEYEKQNPDFKLTESV